MTCWYAACSVHAITSCSAWPLSPPLTADVCSLSQSRAAAAALSLAQQHAAGGVIICQERMRQCCEVSACGGLAMQCLRQQ